jgi:hypothetical protein
LVIPLAYILGSIAVIVLLGVLFKRVLARSPSTLKIWFGGALSAFVGGFVEGCPIGSTAGAGFAVADGQFHADLDWKHLLVELLHLIAIPFGTGLADIRTYIKSCPFPNIFQPAPPPTFAPVPGTPPSPQTDFPTSPTQPIQHNAAH